MQVAKICDKIRPLRIIPYTNVLFFIAIFGWYMWENSSPYKDKAYTLFIQYLNPDHCVITPWSEKNPNLNMWRHNPDFMDICILPEFIDKNKVTLYGISQLLKVQYTDKSSPVYMSQGFSSTIFGTNFNSLLFDGKTILHHPKEVKTDTDKTIDCTNHEPDGTFKTFKSKRPFRVSFLDERFNKQEVDFFAKHACFLTDYFRKTIKNV